MEMVSAQFSKKKAAELELVTACCLVASVNLTSAVLQNN